MFQCTNEGKTCIKRLYFNVYTLIITDQFHTSIRKFKYSLILVNVNIMILLCLNFP